MIRILFVDDDVRILDGIRRSMYSMRAEWQVRFSDSAGSALQQIATEQADVVVSDTRMADMDGPQFLSEVKRLCPKAVRIILSGQTEAESAIRATQAAHQYLSKPCDAPTLKAAIARTMALRSLLSSDHLAAIVGSVEALPTPPKTYQDLLSCLRDPDAAISDVVRIIRRDVAMTANVVKLANSGYFGVREPVQTVERAVSLVGTEAITTLVLGQELFDTRSAIALPGFSLERLGKHSLETAAWARAVALHEGLSVAMADSAFLAGVVHDVGRLVFATRTPPTSQAERGKWLSETTEQMESHHAAVGAYLLGLWGFANPVIGAVAWHHTPSRSGEIGLGLCGVLHIADRLAHERDADASAPSVGTLEPEYLEALGLSDHWPAWLATREIEDTASAA